MDDIKALIKNEIMKETELFITDEQFKVSKDLLPWTEDIREEFRGLLKTPQGIEKVLHDDYFLGLEKVLYNSVREDIVDLWMERRKREINLAIFVESIGSGKSIVSSCFCYTYEGMLSIKEIIKEYKFIKSSGNLVIPYNNKGYEVDKGDNYSISNIDLATSDGIGTATMFYDSGVCPTIKIITTVGFECEGTLHHPILTLNPYGELKWKKLNDCNIGDYTVIKSNTDIWGKEDVDTETAWLLGYIIGDGHIVPNNTGISFTCHELDREIGDRAIGIFNRVGCGSCICKPKKNRPTNIKYSVSGLKDFIKKYDLTGRRSHTKEVPLLIRKSNKESVKAFIRGYYDADGSVDKNGNVRITSVNRELVHQVQLLLLNIGILSFLELKKTSCNGKKGIAWRLKINGIEAKKFFNEIGFSLKRKQDRQKLLKEKSNPNIDIVPNISNYLKRVYSGSPRYGGWRDGKRTLNAKKWNYITNGNCSPSINKLKEFLEEFKDTENKTDWIYLNYLIENNYHFLPIEQITTGQSHVYDLTVPKTENFIANGLVVHNTFKSSIILWLQWFELVCKGESPQEFYNLAAGSVIAFITMSRTAAQARKVAFTEIWNRFHCPFNKDYFPVDTRYTQEVRISRNNTVLFPGTSSALSILGYNVFGGVVDEANYLEVIEDSKKAALTDRYDAAEDMYEAILNRMTSRFMKHGKIPGLLCMISSPRFPDDFLEKKIRLAEKLGPVSGVFWRKRTLWQAKGKKFFSSGKFFYINTDTLEEVEQSVGEKVVSLRNVLIQMKDSYAIDTMGKREDYFKDEF